MFAGQVFQEFTDDPDHYDDRRWHPRDTAFDVPREWNIYRSYDFGYARPFSCGWWAVDHDGCVYRIAELYGCTGTPDEGVLWTPERQFAEIRSSGGGAPAAAGRRIQGVADPAIWDASRGESIYETALKHRIFFVKGDNRRIAGWMQMHYRMSFDARGVPHAVRIPALPGIYPHHRRSFYTARRCRRMWTPHRRIMWPTRAGTSA